MKVNQVVKTKEDFMPLYRKGEKFKVIRINKDENLMPVEAVSFKTGEIYGFEEKEFEDS